MLHGCKTGNAKITSGYRLPAKHVIHTVGPVWNGGTLGEDDLLASCYRRSIELCETHSLVSVAFPAISTGIYRFPTERAAGIAVQTVVGTLAAAPTLAQVIFCCFSDASAQLHQAALDTFGQPLCRLTGRPLHSRRVREGFHEFINMFARAGLRRADACHAVVRPRRRHFRYSRRRAFQPDKLAKITEFFKNEVATGKIAGANVLIQQHGKPVYHETFGVQDVESKKPINDKTIFRLSSLTKAITSVVAMQLVQDGKIKLDDPVSKYIPSFANMKVGEEKKAEDGSKTLELVPLTKPITILDLFRHTSGITYGFYGDSLVRKAYKDANLYAGEFDLAEFAERIAKLPLHNQPGALWQYGHSTDILARIMEIVSGKSLLEIEKEKLLDPLGMTDTNFFVTEPERLQRLAQPVPNDSDFRVGRLYRTEVRQKWESASGGMVSTMSDFSKFAQMLANGGAFEGKTYLSPKTFELMASDHAGKDSGVARDHYYFPGDGFGMGLGLAVRTDPGNAKPPPPGSLGELKWDGAAGCYMVIDRKQDMFFVVLEQTPTERQRSPADAEADGL
jgi:CubicO group peptidase (beta-lactamase class C family)